MGKYQYIADRVSSILGAGRVFRSRNRQERNAYGSKRNVPGPLPLAGELRQIAVGFQLQFASIQLNLVVQKIFGGQRVALRLRGDIEILRSRTVGVDGQ